MKELLKTLCALNGVSGDEDQVREFLAERARPWARSMKVDPLGNLIVWKKGARAAGDRLMLCAHMDEVGLIVTHVTEEGFLKFDFVGGVDRRVAIGKPVVLGPDRVPGVVGIKAIHLVSRDEEKKVPKTDAFYLDIGARDREEALSRVEPGTYGSFVCTPEEFGEGLFKAKPSTTGWAVPCCSSCWRRTCLWTWSSSLLPRRRWAPGEPLGPPSLWLRRPPWCWRPPPPLTCPGWRDTAECAPPAGAP